MISYPIYFLDRSCPHCGKEKLQFYDKFGKIVKTLIYPVEYMVCLGCKRRFFIKWIQDGEKEEYIPIATAKSAMIEFEQVISEYSLSKKRKLD